MDPDPSSLYSVLFSSLLFSVSISIIFFSFLAICALGLLGWLYSAEKAFGEIDEDILKNLESTYPKESNKLSKIYNNGNRLSAVFAVAKILLAVFVTLCLYIVLNALEVDFLIGIGIIPITFVLFVRFLSLKTAQIRSYLHITIRTLYPILRWSMPIANWIVPKEKELSEEDISMDELKAVLTKSEEEQPSIANLNLYKQVLRFDKIKIRHVMRPKRELEGIKVNYNFKEVLEKIKSSHHSRLPVYEGNWTKIHGIIHCKDLLPYIDNDRLDWKKLVRPLIYVQERDNAQAVLKIFQQSKNHMALVQSTSKRLVGLVTLEDITEEIIGEIEDE